MKRGIFGLLLVAMSAQAGTAFLSHSYVSGMNRVCVYDYLGSDYHVTIKSYQICKQTIQV